MKIGIAGNGKIVGEMIGAATTVEGIVIEAICAREKSRAKAEKIADEYGIAKVYTDYSKMLADSDIDFIYVAVANNVHYQYTKQALLAGKNVICEKPFTVNAQETEELVQIAKEKNLFLFEAITVIYSPNYQYIKDNLSEIGALHYVHANYAQYSSRYDKYLNKEVAPAFNPENAGGALYDLNIYNLHFIIGALGMPKDIVYRANTGFNGIDTSGTALLDYDGFTAVCSAAKDSESVSGIVFQGEKGYMRLEGPTNACALIRINKNGQTEKIVSRERYNHRMVDEFVAFEKMFTEKDYTACYENLDHSVKVMQVLEQARKSGKLPF